MVRTVTNDYCLSKLIVSSTVVRVSQYKKLQVHYIQEKITELDILKDELTLLKMNLLWLPHSADCLV